MVSPGPVFGMLVRAAVGGTTPVLGLVVTGGVGVDPFVPVEPADPEVEPEFDVLLDEPLPEVEPLEDWFEVFLVLEVSLD